MAKAASKSPIKAPTPKAPPTKATKSPVAPKKKATVNPYHLIEGTCVAALATLQELELDYQLQSEINWCLGSYRNDGNPIGLFLMAERALAIFKAEHAAKTKGVSPKLIKDIETAIKSR